ncbi:MAG: 50S ribosomal protein L13 [Deltaproteobacteria bacterium]|nr:50S ribosomal protein L13 [Deltaproteobacteria bacterium]
MKTLTYNHTNTDRAWHIVDMAGKTLGRVAARVAAVLRGKHKPTYTPDADAGDFVVIINSDKLVLTGGKLQQKMYRHHTTFPGGLKELVADKMLARDSREMVERAVRGMLPKGPLGRRLLTKLKVYKGAEHPHAAQLPAPLEPNR